MNASVFLDTNVLVYAAVGTDTKRRQAMALIDAADFGTSAQVLQEFFVTVVRRGSKPLVPREAMEWIEQLAQFPCQPIDQRLVRIAIEASERYRLSYWDGAIVAAAWALGCRTLYSEDLKRRPVVWRFAGGESVRGSIGGSLETLRAGLAALVGRMSKILGNMAFCGRRREG